MPDLEALLVVQEHDTALDRLRHQRDALPERAELATEEGEATRLGGIVAEVEARRAEVDRRERRLGDEAASLTARVEELERTMYSGSISSPRELQAMQGEVEQLRRNRSLLEDRELEALEAREAVDAELAGHVEQLAAHDGRAGEIRARVVAREREIDDEIAIEQQGRAAAASGVEGDLLTTYERCRSASRGTGAARLAGNTCQGCHLTIPATEVERIRHQPAGSVSFCDNCGCVLVPA